MVIKIKPFKNLLLLKLVGFLFLYGFVYSFDSGFPSEWYREVGRYHKGRTFSTRFLLHRRAQTCRSILNAENRPAKSLLTSIIVVKRKQK